MNEEFVKYLQKVLKSKEKDILAGKEIILKNIPPSSFLLNLSLKELRAMSGYSLGEYKRIIVSHPLFLTTGIIKIGHKKISLSYSIPENILSSELLYPPWIQRRRKISLDYYPVNEIRDVLFLIWGLVGELLSWKIEDVKNLHTIEDQTVTTLKMSLYSVPERDLAKVTISIISEVCKEPLRHLNEADAKKYLQKIGYIDKDDKPLIGFEEIKIVLRKYDNGLTLRICAYCDKEFFAKGKAIYDSTSCRVAHFQKKKLIGKEALLEDGTKVKIKDVKKDYTLIEYTDKRGIQKASIKKKKGDLPLIVHIHEK
jgi:hypothetical protein